ncbi:MAG TPA: hypothetical protein EYQ70_00940 [Marine Group III euryarchaeote]|jgi:dnd system-associated protein 4|uniref:DNA phosphorothioation-associated protein 4 n=1 Tax=Marine Group III euryarchaeote TaxID=2173149 RepID=A0A7J4GQR8_9ARCH|nr:hypothetical protein [Marine Group III euryarchaeote]
MANVYFDGYYSNRIKQLAVERDERTGKSIFSNNYSLMIFAAMVGRHHNDTCENVDFSSSRVNEIADRVFENNNLDGIVYLLALDAERDGEILREGNENELWKYLEKYAMLGMQEIDKWLSKDPLAKAHDLILQQMKIEARKLTQEVIVEPVDPEF